MAEFVITLLLIGVLIAAGAGVCSAAQKVINFADRRERRKIQAEREAVSQVFCIVNQKCFEADGKPMTDAEFLAAVGYTCRKHRLGDSNNYIVFAGSDLNYLAELIFESVQQTRLWHETYHRAELLRAARSTELESILEEAAAS